MSIAPQCPISADRVDETAVRFGASLVLALATLSLTLGSPWISLALAADFALRAAGHPAWSPVARLAALARKASGLAPRPVNAGPKRFAAWIGFSFALAIALALFLGHGTVALGLAATLGACASLEAFFGLCLGCKVYPIAQALWRPLAPRLSA